jgi:phenylpropionate dioxygenase-like ring-hydroxylating dioxygenase large terminal subunit
MSAPHALPIVDESPRARDATDESSALERTLSLRDFWYVACESRELTVRTVLGRTILDEGLALFRDESGAAVALRDRCMHRAAPLSKGHITKPGCLQCPYHGWVYDARGQVVNVPCEKDGFTVESGKKGGVARTALVHETREEDGLVFVRLRDAARRDAPGRSDIEPFRSPSYGAKGYRTVRLQNRFANNVTNCAENFIDVPHTVFVHPAIFRDSRGQHITVDVVRTEGRVDVTYAGETDNLGWFNWFLNPAGSKIEHTDHFFMPNVTSVHYIFGRHADGTPKKHFVITSQSVPVHDDETLVFTDLTFNYGMWNFFAGPIVRWQGQKVIDQDIEILKLQMDNIRKTGDTFAHTSADTIHLFVESIRDALIDGKDPRALPEKKRRIEFWV